MPPAGIDRFNIVAGTPDADVTGGQIEVFDQDHQPIPAFPPQGAPAVPATDTGGLDAMTTGMPPPDDLFKVGMVRIRLDVTNAQTGVAEFWLFQQAQDRGETGSWIGQVVVGFYGTPRGREAYEPFGRIEIVTEGGGHEIRCMRRGVEIIGPAGSPDMLTAQP